MTLNLNGLPTHTARERTDAVWHQGRYLVPTIYGQPEGNTKWVATWQEFLDAGGVTVTNEDQTEITLTLPEGWKFGCGFNRKQEG